MREAIAFPRRPKVWRSELAVHRVFRSSCHRFEVVDVRWLNPAGYGRYWLAVGRALPHVFVSRHRTRAAAERACLAAAGQTKGRATA